MPEDGETVLARLRNTSRAMPAKIFWSQAGSGSLVLQLDEAQFGIATGQAAAVYEFANPDHLLGGGWISDAPLVAKKNPN